MYVNLINSKIIATKLVHITSNYFKKIITFILPSSSGVGCSGLARAPDISSLAISLNIVYRDIHMVCGHVTMDVWSCD